MNQALAHRLPAESQVPTTPFSAPLLSKLRRGMGRINGLPALMTGFTMSREEHREIEATTSTFRRRITGGPADRAEIGAELARLLAAFPTQGQSDTPAALRVEAYLDAIGTAPGWAVREARMRFVRGEVRDVNPNFAPTPPVFANIVREVLQPLRNDLADLEALCKIGPTFDPSPKERQRVSEGFDKLKTSFGQVSPANLHEKAVEDLEAVAEALGVNLDDIPDQPERTGAFRRPVAA